MCGFPFIFRRNESELGQKDITEKILEAYDDVFSDIVNVLLFDGDEVIKQNELDEQAPRSVYKADGKYREIERDVAKRWRKERIRLACVGFENQTEADADMPLRIIGYDGAEYRSQLNGKQDMRYPVVTMVLYFGYEKHWDKPLRLVQRLHIPERFYPYVNDYKVNLFEIAYLEDEKIKQFQSDFRVVADYFSQKRRTGDYIPSNEQLDHVQETLALLSVMTGDRRFEEAYLSGAESGGDKEVQSMCDVLDRIEKRGLEKGLKKGREEGQVEMALNLHKQGVGLEIIAKAAGVGVEVVERWLGLVPA